MHNKKLIFIGIFSLLSFTGTAQVKPILYGGLDYYRHVGFEPNGFINFNVGAQLFQWHFLAPEIGFEHHFGMVDEVEMLHPDDPNARPPSKLSTRFTANTFSVAPKLKFGNEEASVVLIPQYNFGRILSRADLLQDTGDRYVLDEQQKFSGDTSFWSFAAGVEGQFFDSGLLHFGLLLKYTLLDSEKILQQSDFKNSSLDSEGGSADGLGLSFRVYFDVLELL